MSKQKQKNNNFCTQHVVNLYFSGNSMNNLLSCCGLTDARMRASEKDLPVKWKSSNIPLDYIQSAVYFEKKDSIDNLILF